MFDHTIVKTRVGVAAGALALAVAGATIALGSGASAQDPPATRTVVLKELERGATFKHVRNTRGASPRANSQGDVIVFTNPVADTTGKVVGKLHASCITTVGSRDFRKSTALCAATIRLPDGTLVAQFTLSPGGSATLTAAVTGGTGAYANARGVVVSRTVRGGSEDTIMLTR